MPPRRDSSIFGFFRREEAIAEAIEALDNNEISSVSEAARVFDVARSTLQGHLNARKNGGSRTVLSESENAMLRKWTSSMVSRGADPSRHIIRDMTAFIIKNRGPSHPANRKASKGGKSRGK